MSLIPIEGLGASSQNTNFLGRVVQILIYPRPSPSLADVGIFVRPKSQHQEEEKNIHLLPQIPCLLYAKDHTKYTINSHVRTP